jgi:cytochrome P450
MPKQTPVSQSHWFVHHDEEIFPDSFAFIPERWMGDKQNWDRLSRFMVSFTRGSRQCMGMK